MLSTRKSCRNGKALAALFVLCVGFHADLFADALPAEFYVTPRWRDLFAGHSPTTNPAYMTEENYPTARFALSPTLQTTFLLVEFGYIQPIGLYQSIGAAYLGVTPTDDLEQTVWDPQSGTIVKTGLTYKGANSLFMLSYAINPWSGLSVGSNLNIFHEPNFGDPKISIGIDLGISYRIIRHPLIGDHLVGIAFQNLISPGIGTGEFNRQAANLKMSWLAKIWEKRIETGIDLDIKDFASKAEDFAFGSTKEIEFDFSYRLGFWLLRMINAYFLVGSDYWGLAGGMNVPQVNNGRDFQVLYQYTSMIKEDAINLHTIYARVDLGKHREEVYARKMARLASVGPGNLYNKARTLFSNGKYWDAFFIFGKIIVEYPDFFKNDWVQYFMGRCQEKLDMREVSIDNYDKTKKDYPRSVVVSFADLGLMRIHYRTGNGSGVANQFSRLSTPTVPDSLKNHAFYLMGEQHLVDGNYSKAIQLFELIPEEHPEYIFAQHSLAVSHALNNNLGLAVDALDNCIQGYAQTEAQKEIVNRSYVFLGYIFYEGLGGQNRSLSKAVSALRRVQMGSYYYEDALLGLAWTALGASQWADVLSYSRELSVSSNKVPIQCEGALLEAYALMMQKQYVEAVDILQPAYDKINSAAGPSDADRMQKTDIYKTDRQTYQEIGAKTNNLALTSQSSFVISQIDSLQEPQQDNLKKLKDYYLFTDEFIRRAFFARNIQTVRDDIEYALAKSQKMAGQKGIQRMIEKAGEEAEKIDDEMKKLEEELRQLDQQE